MSRTDTPDRPLLPLVVLGGLPSWQPGIGVAAEQVLLYDTAEQAHLDMHTAAGQQRPTLPQRDQQPAGLQPRADGRWPVNVAYGPSCWGEAIAGHAEHLPHTGATVLVGWGLSADNRNVQMVDGQPAAPTTEGTVMASVMWQAMPLLHGHAGFDLAVAAPGELARLIAVLERLVGAR